MGSGSKSEIKGSKMQKQMVNWWCLALAACLLLAPAVLGSPVADADADADADPG